MKICTSFKITFSSLLSLITIQHNINIRRPINTIYNMSNYCIIRTKYFIINRSPHVTIQKEIRISLYTHLSSFHPNRSNRTQTLRISTFHKIHPWNSHILYNKCITIILDITTINHLGGTINLLFFHQINLRSFINTI